MTSAKPPASMPARSLAFGSAHRLPLPRRDSDLARRERLPVPHDDQPLLCRSTTVSDAYTSFLSAENIHTHRTGAPPACRETARASPRDHRALRPTSCARRCGETSSGSCAGSAPPKPKNGIGVGTVILHCADPLRAHFPMSILGSRHTPKEPPLSKLTATLYSYCPRK